MLRARRLPLLQSPLPGWRATTPAPATAVLAAGRLATASAQARHISSTTTLRSTGYDDDHTAVAQEATQQTRTEEREETKQGGAEENTGERKRVFRKVDPEIYRTRAAIRARLERTGVSEQHLYTDVTGHMPLHGRGTPNTGNDSDLVKFPKFPGVANNSANAVPGGWLRAAAGQPGVGVSAKKPTPSDFKWPMPGQSVFSGRAKIPAGAQAQAKGTFTAVNSVPEPVPNAAHAKARLAQLQAARIPAPFPQRSYGENNNSVAGAPAWATVETTSDSTEGGPSARRGYLVGKGVSPLLQSFTTPKVGGPRFRVVSTSKPYISAKSANQPEKHVKKELSIFDRLFNDKPDNPSPGPKVPNALGPEGEGDINSSSWTQADTPVKPQQIDNSIYGRLFPEEAQAKEEDSEQSPAVLEPGQAAPLDPTDSSLWVSLRNEVRNWIPAADREEVNAPELGEYGSHSTVVVISAVSSTLIDSDFYRIIPEGKHVEGWAGGLVKIVQARHPLSHEPVGQYFLMFHSRPSAVAYAEEVKRLHELSQRLLHAPGSSGRKTARGKLGSAPARPQPFLTEEEKAAVRSFTLCAPDAELRVSVRMWGLLMVGQIASKTDIADVVQALRPEAETPAKVLLVVGGHHGALTARELWLALRDDGRERGTPWVLKNAREGIMPVRTQLVTDTLFKATGRVLLRAEAVPFPLDIDADDAAAAETGVMFAESGVGGGGHLDGDWGEEEDNDPQQRAVEGGGGADGQEEAFNRFVLTFTQSVDARRFVRSWHKRAIWDAEQATSVIIDAVALM